VCTAFTLPADPESWPLLPPIGRPIDGARIWIVETDSGTGELCVGGACLAQGYLHETELTAARFGEVEGLRSYRTGDLVRMCADGNLEFIGRADDQLKVRGFRVEPGEIEAQLSQHPAVRECAVTARDGRLLAYWVGEPVSGAELRAFLVERLAAHLVPSVCTRLEAMPVTPSGKIDRRSLPEPTEACSITPESPDTIRGRIAAAWTEVLGAAVTDPQANFFDLGGTSLRAVAAQQLLEAKLQREIPVTVLFQFPTIEALARHLEVGASDRLAGRVNQRAAAQRAALARRRSQPADA
jgi:acyl carrier protein